MQIENEIKLDFSDVLIKPKRSILTSRKDVNINREFKFRNSNQIFNGVPIVASNMDTTGTMAMALAFHPYRMCVALHKHYPIDKLIEFFKNPSSEFTFYSTGITDQDLEKLALFMKQPGHVMGICIDVANGYTQRFIETVRKIRSLYPTMTIMAGNVVTPEMTEELILSGADIVKVGIGNGSACLTRRQAGVGYPQLSALIECSDAAHGLNGLICCDGGITVPGDLGKAFGGGADFIMSGSMFSAHTESECDIIEEGDEKFMYYYGMSSETAMNKYAGGVAEYRASEGKTIKLKYRGDVENTIKEYLGGLRSTCTYVGALKLKELSKRTTFIRVNNQLNESYGKYKG